MSYGKKYEVRIRPVKKLRTGPASSIVFVSPSNGCEWSFIIPYVSFRFPVTDLLINE